MTDTETDKSTKPFVLAFAFVEAVIMAYFLLSGQ